ncbi:hypothetical protein QL093DRAFT_2063720, partial [Fusarium oxysporum]
YRNNYTASVLIDLKYIFLLICYRLIVSISRRAPSKLDIHLGDIIIGSRVI